MHPKFVQFQTKDGLTLPGLLYEAKKKGAVCIWLHGNGNSSVFYKQEENGIYAGELFKKDVTSLFFNNRGAGVIQKIKVKKGKKIEKKLYGMAYEKIKECIFDIDAAIGFLKTQGYKKFYLAGHSTGANKICVYNYYRPKNPISRYMLLCGGDDVGIYCQMLGKNKFWKLLLESKNKIKKGKGEELIGEMSQGFVFSYQGFYDIANPDGDYNVFPFLELFGKAKLSKKPLLRHFKKLHKPSLVVYGENDEFTSGPPAEALEKLKALRPNLDYVLLKGADHSFSGKEKELAKILSNWI